MDNCYHYSIGSLQGNALWLMVASHRELEANPLSRLIAGRIAGIAAGLAKAGWADRTASLENEEVSARSDLEGFMARVVQVGGIRK